MKKLLLPLVAAAIFALTPLSGIAQTSYGTIAGAVTDTTGAAVAGAIVTVKSKGTGETRTIKSTSNGSFRIESLGTGLYDVTISAPGFSNEVVNGLGVQPSVITSLDTHLKVGAATDTVEVSGSQEILKTESGEVSETIGAQEINELPLSGLNAYNLATTLPGVTTVTTYSPTNGPSFVTNGSRPRENNYLIEGQDNNDAGITGQGLQPENEEAVEAVTFLLNGNPAEFGRGGGAISNLVYHSGTNQYHGAVWDRILNSEFNSVNHSTSYLYRNPNPNLAAINGYAKKPKFRENIYGYRFGGPILPKLKDKAFVFVSQQFDHYRASAVLGTLVLPLANPSAAGTCGMNFTNLNNYKALPNVATLLQAYSGLASPTLFNASTCSSTDPNYRAISLGPDPVTGVDRGLVQFGSYQRSLGNIQNSYEFVIKGDYIVNEKDKLQVRYVVSPFTTPFDVGNFPSQLPNLETDQHGKSYNAGIVENHTFSSRIFNELRLSYGRIGFSFDLTPGTYANPLLGPTVTIASVTGFGIPTNTPQGRFHNTYQLQDALTVVKGSHSMKVGFDVAQVRVRDLVPFLIYGTQNYAASNAVVTGGVTTVSAYTGLGNYIDNFSGGQTGTGASAQKAFGSNLARPTLNNQAYYFQDHWKAASNLALDMGLRYEYYGAPFNYIADPAVDPTNFGAAVFTNRVTVKPNYKNFGPRFGFAYTPFTAAKTVFRGAFGIFYDNVFTNVADNIQASSPNAFTPIIYNGTTTGRGIGNWSNIIPTLTGAPSPLSTVTSVVPNLRNPYTMQYNFAVEQQLPYAMSLTAGYVGNRGVHLYALDYINPTIAGTTTRINNTRGGIAVHDNTGDQHYDSATAELERKYRSGASVRIAYTYAKDLDDVSEEYTSGNYSAYPQIQLPNSSFRGADYGPSAYDHRQRAVLSTVYNVPKFHGNAIVKDAGYIISGFSVSAIVSYQSGSVINTQTGKDINGDGITNDRPVLANPNAPINTFAVRGATADGYYTATTNPTAAPYCSGNVYNRSPTVACVPVTLDQVHYFIGVQNVQNATIARNNSYTPGTFQNDFTLQRTFKTFEHQDFMLRGECFDCMNHANVGIPAATLLSSTNSDASTTFLQYAPTTTGGRTLRIFARYEF